MTTFTKPIIMMRMVMILMAVKIIIVIIMKVKISIVVMMTTMNLEIIKIIPMIIIPIRGGCMR